MAVANKKSPIDWYVVSEVRKLREAKGMTQEDLSIHLGRSTGFIGQIESTKNRAKYNLKHLNELAKLFNCSPRDFIPKEPCI